MDNYEALTPLAVTHATVLQVLMAAASGLTLIWAVLVTMKRKGPCKYEVCKSVLLTFGNILHHGIMYLGDI